MSLTKIQKKFITPQIRAAWEEVINGNIDPSNWYHYSAISFAVAERRAEQVYKLYLPLVVDKNKLGVNKENLSKFDFTTKDSNVNLCYFQPSNPDIFTVPFNVYTGQGSFYHPRPANANYVPSHGFTLEDYNKNYKKTLKRIMRKPEKIFYLTNVYHVGLPWESFKPNFPQRIYPSFNSEFFKNRTKKELKNNLQEIVDYLKKQRYTLSSLYDWVKVGTFREDNADFFDFSRVISIDSDCFYNYIIKGECIGVQGYYCEKFLEIEELIEWGYYDKNDQWREKKDFVLFTEKILITDSPSPDGWTEVRLPSFKEVVDIFKTRIKPMFKGNIEGPTGDLLETSVGATFSSSGVKIFPKLHEERKEIYSITSEGIPEYTKENFYYSKLYDGSSIVGIGSLLSFYFHLEVNYSSKGARAFRHGYIDYNEGNSNSYNGAFFRVQEFSHNYARMDTFKFSSKIFAPNMKVYAHISWQKGKEYDDKIVEIEYKYKDAYTICFEFEKLMEQYGFSPEMDIEEGYIGKDDYNNFFGDYENHLFHLHFNVYTLYIISDTHGSDIFELKIP